MRRLPAAAAGVLLLGAPLPARAARCAWAESSPPTVFENDMYVTLRNYLTRARAALAQSPPTLEGFAALSDAEAAKIPGTLKSQGLAFDGAAPVFSWRYGLQRTDESYRPMRTRPLAIPSDIRAEHYDRAKKNGYSHIGDIDIAGGRLYAPIEDEDNRTKPFITIFDPKTLRYTGEKHLLPADKLPHGVPWVAVDSSRGVFYTMNWDSQELQVFDLKTFAHRKTVTLRDSGAPGRPILRVQGGKVRAGLLYVSSDAKDRKRVYEVDPERGAAREILSFEEDEKAEVEGLAFGPDGTLHLLVMAPYFYDERFPPELEIDEDDWSPSASLRHYRPLDCR